MIRIVVTLVPKGNEAEARELARAELGNLSRLGPPYTHSDYSIWANEGENPLAQTGPWESRGMIGGHDRRGSVWALVASAAAWAVGQADARSRG